MTKQIMGGNLLGAVVDAGQILRSISVSPNIFKVPYAKLLTHFRRSQIVTNEKDLDIGVKTLPALNRVSLNNIDVPDKRLRGRKDCEHCSRLNFPLP
jgi:hypothetical protein